MRHIVHILTSHICVLNTTKPGNKVVFAEQTCNYSCRYVCIHYIHVVYTAHRNTPNNINLSLGKNYYMLLRLLSVETLYCCCCCCGCFFLFIHFIFVSFCCFSFSRSFFRAIVSGLALLVARLPLPLL